jgi:hypothetical protein
MAALPLLLSPAQNPEGVLDHQLGFSEEVRSLGGSFGDLEH